MRDRERETKMVENKEEFESIRQMHTVLSLHYLEEMKQSEIAVRLNLSTSKVNRLIAQGKRMGMVKIVIESPYQPLVDLTCAACSDNDRSSRRTAVSILG